MTLQDALTGTAPISGWFFKSLPNHTTSVSMPLKVALGSGALLGLFLTACVREQLFRPCPFGLPRGAVRACGKIQVSKQYAQPQGATLPLAFAVLPGRSKSAVATVVIPGGPGGRTGGWPRRLEKLFRESGRRPLHDLIFYDQRGVGESREGPQTTCHIRLLTAELAPQEFEGQVRDCLNAMKANGNAPATLNTRSNAEDIVSLARALGYQQVNLYGLSYGTRTAQEVVKRHPEFVRSLVLDGVVDPAVNPFVTQPQHFQKTLSSFGQVCAAAGHCPDGDYPTRIQQAANELGALNLTFPGEVLGVQRPLPLKGSVLLSALWDTGYSPRDMQAIDEMLRSGPAKDRTTLDSLVKSAANEGGNTVDPGVYAAVSCQDTRLPEQGIQSGLLPVFQHRAAATVAMYRLCRDLGLGAPADAQAPIRAKVPTLLLSGRYDSVTPPETAQAVAARFSPSTHVIFEQGGHMNGKSECGLQLLLGFLDDPSRPPETQCAARPYSFQ